MSLRLVQYWCYDCTTCEEALHWMEEFENLDEERIELPSTSASHVDDVDSKDKYAIGSVSIIGTICSSMAQCGIFFHQFLGCKKVSSRWVPSNPSTTINLKIRNLELI
ncbi:hypothetical protein AVEN_73337-1 [Araneus ventricosus]|uniref:Uncharacterized protein n=1 Tax=Araneus ventricosus TaxID=182803 RepID=A0A4Y2Q7P2_ARAVE|nr:hypothetical protein AVEN_73337-1 [Araneus ventricosus]